MQTFLNPQGHASTKIRLNGISKTVELDCMIDTGFSGGISLPRELQVELDFLEIYKSTWELADGSQVESEIYAGKIETPEGVKEIAVIFSNGREGLVGIEFLRGKKFVLDLKKNETELS